MGRGRGRRSRLGEERLSEGRRFRDGRRCRRGEELGGRHARAGFVVIPI
jgi:hypothetical protein